jgi:S-DNA-T family DNA segregation ATPase FtsK/SpoIIIE
VGVYLWYVVQCAGWLFLTAALLSFSPGDWPGHAAYPHNEPVANWCGVWGAVPAYWLLYMFGAGAWVLLAMWGLHLVVTGFVSHVTHAPVRALGAVVMAVAVATYQGAFWPSSGALPDLGGGLVGTYLAGALLPGLAGFGTFLVATLGLMVGAVVALDAWVILAPVWAWKQARRAAPPVIHATARAADRTWSLGRRISALFRRSSAAPAPVMIKGQRRRGRGEGGAERAGTPGSTGSIDERAGGLGGTESFNPDEHPADESPSTDDASGAEESVLTAEEGAALETARENATAARASRRVGPRAKSAGAESSPDEGGNAPVPAGAGDEPGRRQFTAEELRAKISRLPVRFASAERTSAKEADLRDIQNVAELEGYRFPGLDLLEEPEVGYPAKMEAFVREQATALESGLKQYRIDGEVVGIESGPVITMYEIRLAPGTKVSALQAVSSDLARTLKAVNVRIVPNTEGRDTVGVEVPNPNKEKVRLKELMSRPDTYAKMNLPMFLGKDASGNPLVQDLTKMPHMLIAGTTGSGKSVCMSAILMSFLYTKKPNELKLVLVDPKMVELSQFKDVPHLMCPVVTEMSKAAAILEWAVRKMDERYELLVEAGCTNVSAYNALSWEELKERFKPANEADEARIPKKLPYMVFVIDELADLMMTNREVETSIIRLAQKARAVGMHLILATQRPQANVVTGLIKSNMPCRIAFKVASGMDSRIVMDQKGAELLLGQGDMLFLSPRSSELTRAQGTLMDDKEIRRVVTFLKDVAAPTFERSLMQIRTGAAAGAGLADADEDDGRAPEFLIPGAFGNDGVTKGGADPLFEKAVEIVLETQKGSVSMLQRRLAIGYTRASRLMDAMWKAGIVGDHKGTVDRNVLIGLDEWQAMKAQIEADASGGAEAPPAGVVTRMSQNAAPAGVNPAAAGGEDLGELASEERDRS